MPDFRNFIKIRIKYRRITPMAFAFRSDSMGISEYYSFR